MNTCSHAESLAWAEREFGHAQLGDRRRTRRLVSIAAAVRTRPAGTVSAVFDTPAALHGAYDFLENDAAEPASVALAMAQATAERAREFPSAWAVTDGTSVSITDRAGTKGTGRIGCDFAAGRGDKIHSVLVLDPDGVPLGLCTLLQWQRPKRRIKDSRGRRTTAQKETQRWLDARALTRECFAQHAPNVRLHFLHDREADAWPIVLDACEHRAESDTTIRAQWDRRLWEPEESDDPQVRKVRQALAQASIRTSYTLPITAARGRSARVATMEVRACTVTLALRDKKRSDERPARVSFVCTREVSAVPKGQRPIEWLLLTTREVTGAATALEIVRGYTHRWRIEEFHKAWKSAGTDIEATQLRAPDHRARWELILGAVAVSLLRWQILSAERPETPMAGEVDAETLEALRDLQTEGVVPERGGVTVRQFVHALAYLGGWTGATRQTPGMTPLLRGWRDVCAHRRGLERRRKRLEERSEPHTEPRRRSDPR